jgi:hypothetical protein
VRESPEGHLPPRDSLMLNSVRVVGVAQLVERRTVAPNVAGSNPVSHPNLAMGFNRQLDIFVAITAALVTFVSCILGLEIPVTISFLIALCVLVGGLVFGRRFADTVNELWTGLAQTVTEILSHC